MQRSNTACWRPSVTMAKVYVDAAHKDCTVTGQIKGVHHKRGKGWRKARCVLCRSNQKGMVRSVKSNNENDSLRQGRRKRRRREGKKTKTKKKKKKKKKNEEEEEEEEEKEEEKKEENDVLMGLKCCGYTVEMLCGQFEMM